MRKFAHNFSAFLHNFSSTLLWQVVPHDVVDRRAHHGAVGAGVGAGAGVGVGGGGEERVELGEVAQVRLFADTV